ncbi:MAG: sugar-binding domain-containing protein [Rhodoferax sp.]|uniref:sugar-binding domain-containing protein n=3 Tax=Rhodoferax sp. TaxID=50421 RepID=UPI0032678E4B
MQKPDSSFLRLSSGAPTSLNRRRLLHFAAATAALPLMHACGGGNGNGQDADLVAAEDFANYRARSFDDNWLFYQGVQPAGTAALAAFADQAWRTLDLPHDWSIEDLPGGSDDGAATAQPSHLFIFEQPALSDAAPARIGPFDKNATEGDRATGRFVGGEGWYRKHFVANPAAGQRFELQFDGVYQNSDVWINGQHLGFHPYGYTAFSYDLTPYLKAGENVVAVRVQNIGKNSRWYSGSGIYRHTRLVVTGGVSIPTFGVGLTTQQLTAAEATVSAQVSVQNTLASAAQATVRVAFYDALGHKVATATSAAQSLGAGAQQDMLLTLTVSRPQPWTPGTPTLYTAVVQVLVDGAVQDQTVETFGIRTVQISATDGFLLNGTPLKLRGGNVHHDNGPLGAVSLGDHEYWRMAKLKQGGYNAIRIAHNPPSREFLKAADQLGMLLINEFLDMWDVAKNDNDYHLYFADWWPRDLTSWVLSSRNSPAVVIWSIANEIYDSAAAEPIGRQMAAQVRALDRSRPLMQGGAQGILGLFNAPTVASYTDFGDVHYKASFAAEHLAVPDKAWLQSESFPVSAYDHWKLVTDNRFVMGDFVWTAWDYLGEAGLGVPKLIPKDSDTETIFLGNFSDFGKQAGGAWGVYPWFAAGCGDFDLIGQVAPQHLYRRVVWDNSAIEMAVARPVSGNRQQQAFAYGWFDELESWTWDVAADTPMRVHVYTSADQVDLYRNGTLLASRGLSATDKLIASFWVPYQTGSIRAVALRNGVEIGRKELVTVGAPAALLLTSDTSLLGTSRDAMAHVLAQVVDSAGRLVPDAVVRVSFTATGGELAAVGSGNPHNVDSFRRGKRYTYQGKAMAYVRPPKSAGKILLTASADGLRSASLELTAR